MSESYEGIVFRATEDEARAAFRASAPAFPARLVALADGIFGAYRDVERGPFDTTALHRFASALSGFVGAALAVSYDNGCGVRASTLFRDGQPGREFGEADEEWVPLDEDGIPMEDGPRFKADHLDEDEEYDCVRDAIRLGLAELGVRPAVDAGDLKDAFSYGRRAVIESWS